MERARVPRMQGYRLPGWFELDRLLPESPVLRLRGGIGIMAAALAATALVDLAGPLHRSPTGAAAAILLSALMAVWALSMGRGRLVPGTDVLAGLTLAATGFVLGGDGPAVAMAFGAAGFRGLYPGRVWLPASAYALSLAVGVWLGGEGDLAADLPLALTLCFIPLCAVLNEFVARGLLSYEETREELAATHAELENRVRERTRDLAAVNARLEEKVLEAEAAEDLVQRSAAYFRALIENGSDLVVVLRPDGRIRYVSPSVERLIGFTVEETLGQSFAGYVVDDDLPGTLGSFNQVLQTPSERLSLNVRVRHADGGERTLEAIAHNLVDNPAVAGVVFSARDVTDRITVEQALRDQEVELRQAQKMEAVGRLAGGVAHDFNNILTVIGGHAEYLQARLPGSEPLREEAVEIVGAVERAARLTRQLLVFSRREVAQPQILQLEAAVENVYKLLARLLPETVRLETRLDAGTRRIEADPGHVEQVVLNLVVNARDAMADGGTLTIAVEERDVSEAIPNRFGDVPAGRHVILRVEDTGCGIPPDVLERIFDPFFTTKGSGGTGLGLSTVFGITQEADAVVRVETEEGRGTRFEIFFPARDEAANDPVGAVPEGTSDGAGETLLLVEDEERLRSLAARSLRERGYVVLTAAEGEEALRIASLYEDPIDLLVSDVVMPGLSGPELHRALEEERGRVPVLFMSGYPGRELERHGIDPAGLLAKPFSGQVLAEAARRVLDAG